MIQKSPLKLIFWGLLTAAMLAFIWGNSLMVAESSSQISGWVGKFLGKIFPFFSPDSPNGSHLLRKCAHFAEFCVLGGLLLWGSAMLLKKEAATCCAAFLCGLAAATVDESIQRFIPGRYGCMEDVLLDSAGVLTGVAAVFVLILFLRKLRKQ